MFLGYDYIDDYGDLCDMLRVPGLLFWVEWVSPDFSCDMLLSLDYACKGVVNVFRTELEFITLIFAPGVYLVNYSIT